MILKQLREEMVDIGLDMLAHNLVVLSEGGLSARDPETGLITVKPSGVRYTLIKPEDVLVMDIDGNIVDGKLRPSHEYKTWLQMYREREDINAIVHTHSTYATCCAALGRNVLPLNAMSATIGGVIKCCEDGEEGSYEMGSHAIAGLEGWKLAVLLPHHGVFTVGKTLFQAFAAAVVLEDSAKMNIICSQLGTPTPIDEDISKQVALTFQTYYQK